MTLDYFINLDERGEFYADVRDENGFTVLDIHGGSIFEDGFMKHNRDMDGLRDYMADLGLMRRTDTVRIAN